MTEAMTEFDGGALETSVVQQLTSAEVDMQVATAKRWPRSIDTFKKRARTLATADAKTAQSCFYVMPRGGKAIEGPGARLAEIVATAWGNLRCETRVIGATETQVTAQATAWDMEANVLIRCETSRRITGRDGRRYNEDMIIMTGNAAASIALRNAIFKVVPFAHVQDIYEQCKKVASGGKSVGEAKAEWFAAYKKAGVEEARVLAMLGKKAPDDVGLEEIAILQGLWTALSEGSTTVEQAFPAATLEEGTQAFGFKAKEQPTDKPKQGRPPKQKPADAPKTEAAPKQEEQPWKKHETKEGDPKQGKDDLPF